MTTLLEVDSVSCRFPLGGGRWLRAVDGVSFKVGAGEAVALVGESGCGKSTLARLINRLVEPQSGRIMLGGRDIGSIPVNCFARDAGRSSVQMVFQDATDSLDPRHTAHRAIGSPVTSLLRLNRAQTDMRVRDAASLAGLPADLLRRYPHQLSGGQKARVGIARALATRPSLLVLDEPTSALDVSVQAVVLRLLDDLRTRLGVALLFISHDLNVVRLLCSVVLVMYRGQVVESGPADRVFAAPRHPYTQALVDAIPDPERRGRPARVDAEMGPATDTSCRFAGRCPKAQPRCTTDAPLLREVAPQQRAACHFA